MEINTKKKNYTLLKKGILGNTMETFSSLKDVENSGLRWVGARYSDRSISGKSFFIITTPDKIRSKVNNFINQGADLNKFIFGETDVEVKDKLLIQGEVGEIYGNFELAYSLIPGITNREASNRGYKRVVGLQARLILKHYMWAADYEWLFKLLDDYSDHIIEFSTFSIPVGKIPNRNTIIWEVRKY